MENSLCPLDNRYHKKVDSLCEYYSYKSWIKYRLNVELEYFNELYLLLHTISNDISNDKMTEFLSLSNAFNLDEILSIEKTTLHDIKAIELYLRNQYDKLNIGPPQYKELIHFGLTSQDINSVAFSLQLKDCMSECIIPKLNSMLDTLYDIALKWRSVTILALTHGQPAIPTRLGKEIEVYIERLVYCIEKLQNFEYYTKIGGAVGTLAAHYLTYPEYDWLQFFNNFCRNLGLTRWQRTTQITNYEDIIELSQILIRINNIFVDFCQDIWLYISNKIFILNKELESQVGSSTMPQKVNPINFENAEGNLKLANSGLEFFSGKLPISRLQRDLTDSTVLRNYGMYIGYMTLAFTNIEQGIKQLKPNIEEINLQLNKSPEIMSEAVQCLLRKHGIADGYEIVRSLTQHIQFNNLDHFKEEIIKRLQDIPDIPDILKNEILDLNFNSYLGFIR